MIFSGEFDHRIDSQGRVAIPVRFRDAFKPGMVLAEGYDRCIDVYTLDEWERVAGEITGRPSTNANRRLARARFAGAFTADLDRQGRVVIPAPLREYAGVDAGAVVIGVGRYLELWNPDTWGDERAVASEQAADIAEQAAVSDRQGN